MIVLSKWCTLPRGGTIKLSFEEVSRQPGEERVKGELSNKERSSCKDIDWPIAIRADMMRARGPVVVDSS